ncbi:MAG: inositol monophosphatase family protein [Lacisediminihabitans sp.]
MSVSTPTVPQFPPAGSAHRGDSSCFRENTLPAIRSAITAGAAFVEVDVRVTADGAVVLLHDTTLERLWGIGASVSDVTLAQIAELGDQDHRPPLLSEAAALFTDSRSTLLIDMETGDPAEAAYRVMADSTISISWCGHIDGMRTIRALDPSARIWMPWNTPQPPTAPDLVGVAPEYLNMDFRWLTEKKVDDIHALGCKVAVWTIDQEETMRWALCLGADSVTTNRLSVLQQVIRDVSSGEIPLAASESMNVDLDAALSIARHLGEWAIDFARTTAPGKISTKENAADLVTEVDVAVERHIREVIGQAFPSHSFVGEEMGGAATAGAPCWYLDPVDGTTNFANRIPWNAFSLALAIDDTPLVGVVADPWRNELFEAVRGRGAKLNAEPLIIPTQPLAAQLSKVWPPADPLSGRVVSTELAAHLAWPGMLEMLQELGERYCTMRIMGSGTMTLVGIAAGRGVGSVIGSFGPADHLAAVLIVEEAGGVVLDSAGRRTLFPKSGGIMAAAPTAAIELHDLWQACCTIAKNGANRNEVAA